MREILLHGGHDDAYDRSVLFAQQLAHTFGARLHIVYTVEDAVGWLEEIRPEQLPDVHMAIEAKARERLSRLIAPDAQERLNINLVLRMGPAERELTAFTEEQTVDLTILHAPLGEQKAVDLARGLVDHARCAVLVLR